jgi:hypothetical protein
MKMIFPNYVEAEKQLRKHLNLPDKLRFKIFHKSYVKPAGEGYPAVVGLHQGYMPEYHNRSSYVAITPQEVPRNAGAQWIMAYEFDLPWIFVDTMTWEEITEEEFMKRVNKILKD